ncbi:MAG: methyltransferase domain-containing protein [Actinomycetota bacterium]|nr:methyltransferase domain-containing protein [Actinomycetota bacterium]
MQDTGREVTEGDRAVLARWTSWGAVPKIFDEDSDQYAPERAQLQELLDPDEFRAARRTVLNAHYTDDAYARSIWSTVTGLGLTGGQVLEPGCGTGAFLGAAPSGVSMTGVELDPATAAIATSLHPGATIRSESFARSPFADDTFDAAVGNVPFGSVRLHDRAHNAGHFTLHNHFIVKSLDLVRPGGLVAVLTSRYTMDAQDERARQAMFDRADLVGAVRLPTGAHRAVAGTEAVTDLVVLRKRTPGQAPGDEGWVHTATVDLLDGDGQAQPTVLNTWWGQHSDMVLGSMSLGHGMYSSETLVVRRDPAVPMDVAFGKACEQVVADGVAAGLVLSAPDPSVAVIDAGGVIEPVARAGDVSTFTGHISFNTDQARWEQVKNDQRVPLAVPASQDRQLRGLVGLRDATVALLDAEASSMNDSESLRGLRADLNSQYEAYVDRFGPVNKATVSVTSRLDKSGQPIVSRRFPGAMRTFRSDPHRAVVCSLENYDERSGTATKAAIFAGRVITARVVPTSADSPADALAIVMDATGRVDLDRIGALLGVDEDQARQQLGTLVYADPASGGDLVPAAQYLSGNVRHALQVAEDVLAGDPGVGVNVEALRAVLPADIGPDEITARLGAVWVPAQDVTAFLRETLGDRSATVVHGGGSMWKVRGATTTQAASSQWGTPRMDAITITERLMCQKRIVVTDEHPDTGARIVNAVETEAAQEKAGALQGRFEEWLWADPERASRLTTRYNEMFNSLVLRDYTADGARLSLPGLAATFTPHEHQRSAVARIISEPSVGLYHGVGAGKTTEMVMGAMELGRLGLVNKPAIVVPNHMLEQFTREWLQRYPQANVLAAGSEDLRGDGRREFAARAATGAWDGIVMTQGAFAALSVSPAVEHAYMDRELDIFRGQLQRMKADSGSGMTVKRMERALEKMEDHLTEKLDRARDVGVTFEQTGIDYLLVDELHMYKNLTVASNIEGVARAGSQRATDLDMKIDYLRERALNSGRSPRVLTGATATPIANSMSEAWVMQKYLRPDLLADAGITDFDAWAATFGESVTELEMAPEGGGFRPKTRFARFNNLPELLRMWHVSADVKTSAQLALNIPDVAQRADGQRSPETVVVGATHEMTQFMSELGERAERVRARQVRPEEDNMLKISGDGRKAALDLRLVDRDDSDALLSMGKLDAAAARIHHIWTEHQQDQFLTDEGQPHPNRGGFQIVFCDLGTPNPTKWNAYEDLREKLAGHGMDPSRVAFVHDANTDAKKDRLFADCRTGGVDVLIGSTAKMGVGTNMQTRAVALHHLDCPWRPADVEQREGRILRQGNQVPEVQVLRYVVEGSFDGYMWQTVERKAKFIDQVMNGTLDTRDAEDISSDAALSFNEVKALASGNPLLLEKATADQALAKLENLSRAHQRDQTYRRGEVARMTSSITVLEQNIPLVRQAASRSVSTQGDQFTATTRDGHYSARTDAAASVAQHTSDIAMRARGSAGDAEARAAVTIGGHDFDIRVHNTLGSITARYVMSDLPDHVEIALPVSEATASTGYGTITRLENAVASLPALAGRMADRHARTISERDQAAAGLGLTFPRTDDLTAARGRVKNLTEQLIPDKKTTPDTDSERSATDAPTPVIAGTSSPVTQEQRNAEGRAKVQAALEKLNARPGRTRHDDHRHQHQKNGPSLR